MRKKLSYLILLLCLASAAPVHAVCFQPTIWDGIVKANVDEDGYVNYDAIRVNKGGDLYEFIARIETVDLKKCNEDERQAFWINAYNAHAVRLLLARPELKTLSDDFKLFGEKFKVAKANYTLNEIHHRILRSSAKNGGPIEGVSLKEFDPRIHFALVWGAVDCPPLSNRAYTAATLNEMLNTKAELVANNPKFLRVENGVLTMTSLLHWYMADFAKVGGVPVYLNTLLEPASRPDGEEVKAALIAATAFPENVIFKYDWTVNSLKNKPAAAAPAAAQ